MSMQAIGGRENGGGSGAQNLSPAHKPLKMQVTCPVCQNLMMFEVGRDVPSVRITCTKCETLIDAATKAPQPAPQSKQHQPQPRTGREGVQEGKSVKEPNFLEMVNQQQLQQQQLQQQQALRDSQNLQAQLRQFHQHQQLQQFQQVQQQSAVQQSQLHQQLQMLMQHQQQTQAHQFQRLQEGHASALQLASSQQTNSLIPGGGVGFPAAPHGAGTVQGSFSHSGQQQAGTKLQSISPAEHTPEVPLVSPVPTAPVAPEAGQGYPVAHTICPQCGKSISAKVPPGQARARLTCHSCNAQIDCLLRRATPKEHLQLPRGERGHVVLNKLMFPAFPREAEKLLEKEAKERERAEQQEAEANEAGEKSKEDVVDLTEEDRPVGVECDRALGPQVELLVKKDSDATDEKPSTAADDTKTVVVKDEASMLKAGDFEIPRKDLVTEEMVGEVLSCWAALRRAGRILQLPSMSLQAFLQALSSKGPGSDRAGLVVDIHIALLTVLCAELKKHQIRSISVCNVFTWMEILRLYLLYMSRNLYSFVIGCNKDEMNERTDQEAAVGGTNEGEQLRKSRQAEMDVGAHALGQVVDKLARESYFSLAMEERLLVLSTLCAQLMGARPLRTVVEIDDSHLEFLMKGQSEVLMLLKHEEHFFARADGWRKNVTKATVKRDSSGSRGGESDDETKEGIRSEAKKVPVLVRQSKALADLSGNPLTHSELLGAMVQIVGSASGEKLKKGHRTCKGVVARQLLGDWYEIRRGDWDHFQGRQAAQTATQPREGVDRKDSDGRAEGTAPKDSDTQWDLLLADVVLDDVACSRYAIAVKRAKIELLLQIERRRIELQSRLEPLGLDRHMRPVFRLCGGLDQVWVLTQKHRWMVYKGTRLRKYVDALDPEIPGEKAIWKELRQAHLVLKDHWEYLERGGALGRGEEKDGEEKSKDGEQQVMEGKASSSLNSSVKGDATGFLGHDLVLAPDADDEDPLDPDLRRVRDGELCALEYLEEEAEETTCPVTGEAINKKQVQCALTYAVVDKEFGKEIDPNRKKQSKGGKAYIQQVWSEHLKDIRAILKKDKGSAFDKLRKSLLARGRGLQDGIIQGYSDLIPTDKLEESLHAVGLGKTSEQLAVLLKMTCPSSRKGLHHFVSLLTSLQAVIDEQPLALPQELQPVKRALMDLEAAIPDKAMPCWNDNRRDFWTHVVKHSVTVEELLVGVLYLETCLDRDCMIGRWRPTVKVTRPGFELPPLPRDVQALLGMETEGGRDDPLATTSREASPRDREKKPDTAGEEKLDIGMNGGGIEAGADPAREEATSAEGVTGDDADPRKGKAATLTVVTAAPDRLGSVEAEGQTERGRKLRGRVGDTTPSASPKPVSPIPHSHVKPLASSPGHRKKPASLWVFMKGDDVWPGLSLDPHDVNQSHKPVGAADGGLLVLLLGKGELGWVQPNRTRDFEANLSKYKRSSDGPEFKSGLRLAKDFSRGEVTFSYILKEEKISARSSEGLDDLKKLAIDNKERTASPRARVRRAVLESDDERDASASSQTRELSFKRSLDEESASVLSATSKGVAECRVQASSIWVQTRSGSMWPAITLDPRHVAKSRTPEKPKDADSLVLLLGKKELLWVQARDTAEWEVNVRAFTRENLAGSFQDAVQLASDFANKSVGLHRILTDAQVAAGDDDADSARKKPKTENEPALPPIPKAKRRRPSAADGGNTEVLYERRQPQAVWLRLREDGMWPGVRLDPNDVEASQLPENKRENGALVLVLGKAELKWMKQHHVYGWDGSQHGRENAPRVFTDAVQLAHRFVDGGTPLQTLLRGARPSRPDDHRDAKDHYPRAKRKRNEDGEDSGTEQGERQQKRSSKTKGSTNPYMMVDTSRSPKPTVKTSPVWVTLKDESVWPGLVVDPHKIHKSCRPEKERASGLGARDSFVLVLFLAKGELKWVKHRLTRDFEANLSAFRKTSSADAFKAAVKMARDFVKGDLTLSRALLDAKVLRAQGLLEDSDGEQGSAGVQRSMAEENEDKDLLLARALQEEEAAAAGDGDIRRRSGRMSGSGQQKAGGDDGESNEESDEEDEELEEKLSFVMARAYSTPEVGMTPSGLAAVVYLLDASYDFDKNIDDDDDDDDATEARVKRAFDDDEKFKGKVTNSGELVCVRREKGHMWPGEVCKPVDMQKDPRHPGQQMVTIFGAKSVVVVVEGQRCVPFKYAMTIVQDMFRTTTARNALDDAEARQEDLDKMGRMAGVDPATGMYRLPEESDKIMRIGAVLEVEVEDPKSKKIEWVPGRIKRVNTDGSFMVHIIVIKSDERGEWEETYAPGEEGKEWRWPLAKARR